MKATDLCPMTSLSAYITVLLCMLFAAHTASAGSAIVPDYFADNILCQTTIDISSTQLQPTSLQDILLLIEKQTQLKLIYLNTQIPSQDRLLIESPSRISLAHLLYSITTMTGVSFSRHQQKIVVRSPMETGGQSIIASAP